MRIFSAFLSFSLLLMSCEQDVMPKPNAYLKLSYPKANYQKSNIQLPYHFQYSNQAILSRQYQFWSDLHYPKLNADINMTYQKVENNLTQLMTDAEKLTYKHALKADHIEMHPYENANKKVYAKLFEVSGNAASSIQFQATDSTKHFLSGALYFDARPNYDSILPAIDYIKKDIEKLIETLEWKN
ncbi:gliding motility lipoprotein GldD [Wenyingzhuangia fucanilytica]|uniref:Gliding motility lipoprotein GldD n=1 Tax=Wenyingzhuangia fucanilytica TaxID=1790137 RepID=A0A1B1Y8V2_9FLAO|nr:gliding motility lipoprotein GldD [Wenyingzhuangia fucanilytica]ANW97195.1 gliding motility lipoprotein GldD [Wenyingzhuangia fucanilytica]